MSDFEIDNDPFHALAFQAHVIEANRVQGEPDPEKVRQLAYQMYEDLKRGR